MVKLDFTQPSILLAVGPAASLGRPLPTSNGLGPPPRSLRGHGGGGRQGEPVGRGQDDGGHVDIGAGGAEGDAVGLAGGQMGEEFTTIEFSFSY